ncbi:hypothetical protein [Sphingomonas montana]|uniref:hypothetical protein n=1 Tax=Sphingomonas montana TaxID=1843236 RepID=UPI00101AD2C3|nr:hypothetical protein [Sphingomonas montana]
MARALIAGTMMLYCAAGAIAAPPAKDAIERSSDPRDKMVCKRFLETGSLVKGQRVCKTKGDWERSRAEARMLDTTRSCGAAGTEGLCK